MRVSAKWPEDEKTLDKENNAPGYAIELWNNSAAVVAADTSK